MDYRPPWDFQDGPPRIEQGIDAELGLSDGLFPNVVPTGPRSTPALEDVSVTGYHDLVSHSYSAGTTEAASFHASSAFGSTGGFPMQQHPINNTWNQPPPPNQFHGLGFSTWTPPNAFVASQATAHEQGHPVLRFSCGLMSPIAAYPGQAASNMANDMAPQQPHSQAVSRLTSGPRAFQVIRRHFQHLRRSTPQDIESCWRCKSDHKKVRISAQGGDQC